MMTKNITPGGYREVWKVAAPIILSMASFTMMQFCDRIFLAHDSQVSLRAALPAGMLALTLTMFFSALASYSGTFVAQYFGSGDKLSCGRATAQGAWMSLAAWPLMLLLIPVGMGLLNISQHPADVLAAEKMYFMVLMVGGIWMSLGQVFTGFFSGRGDTVTPMMANLIGNALNALLDYVLIFGKWGAPRMGIFGAALATVLAGMVSALILIVLYFGKRYRKEYGTWKTFRPHGELFRRMLRFGVPAAIHSVMDVGSFAVFVILLGQLDAKSMAASNIAFSINNLAFMPLLGMSIAASILVGQYQGARNSTLAAKSAMTSLKMAFYYMVGIGSSFILFPRMYFSMFTGDASTGMMPLEDVISAGRWMLVMMGLWGLLDTVNIVLGGALKGAGDTRFVLIYTIVVSWLLWLPGVVFIVRYRHSMLEAWLWMAFIVVVMATGFWTRFHRGRWKNIRMIEHQPLPVLEGPHPDPIHPV